MKQTQKTSQTFKTLTTELEHRFQADSSVCEKISTMNSMYSTLEEDNTTLRFQNDQLKKLVYGQKSEKSNSNKYPAQEDQPSLFGDPVVEEPEPEEEPEKPKKKTGKKRGRKPIPKTLKTEEIIVEAPQEKTVDEHGNKLDLLGYTETERLDYVPGTFTRIVFKHEQWGYKDSSSPKVKFTAPLNAIVQNGKLTDTFIEHIVFQKFFMGLPLYRQLQEYNSHGVQLAKSTLSDAIKQFAKLHIGTWWALRAEVFSERWAHLDETGIKYQANKVKKARLKNKQQMKKGCFWVARREIACFFQFGTTNSSKELLNLLDFSTGIAPLDSPVYCLETGLWGGFLMADAHSSHCSKEVKAQTAFILQACWVHVRRKFYDLKDAQPDAKVLLDLINQLYTIERQLEAQAKKQNWDLDTYYSERKKVRQDESKAIVAQIKEKVQSLSQLVIHTPTSPMGRAITYAANQFTTTEAQTISPLEHFLKEGYLPIDNNPAERSIRPVAIGRKNYLFVGSEDAGEWAAICYSIVESCRLLNIDPADYMRQTTPMLLKGEDPVNLTPYKMKDQVRSMPTSF